MEDLSARAEYATVELEIANRQKLFAELDTGFSAYTTEECLRRLDEYDILCAPVLDYDAVLSSPQVEANGTLIDLPTASGTVRTVGTPLRLSGAGERPVRRPPQVGEHTVEVLAELGVESSRIDDLTASGVIRGTDDGPR
jgi:formyl-CoA transferase